MKRASSRRPPNTIASPDALGTAGRPRPRSALGTHAKRCTGKTRSSTERSPPPYPGSAGRRSQYWQTASLLKHFLANSNETTRGSSCSELRRAAFSGTTTPCLSRWRFSEGGASLHGLLQRVERMPMTSALRCWADRDGASGASRIFSDGRRRPAADGERPQGFPGPAHGAAAASRPASTSSSSATTRRVTEALDRGLLTEKDLDAAASRPVPRRRSSSASSIRPSVCRTRRSARRRPGALDAAGRHGRSSTRGDARVHRAAEERERPPAAQRRVAQSIAVIGPRANTVSRLVFRMPPYAVTPRLKASARQDPRRRPIRRRRTGIWTS